MEDNGLSFTLCFFVCRNDILSNRKDCTFLIFQGFFFLFSCSKAYTQHTLSIYYQVIQIVLCYFSSFSSILFFIFPFFFPPTNTLCAFFHRWQLNKYLSSAKIQLTFTVWLSFNIINSIFDCVYHFTCGKSLTINFVRVFFSSAWQTTIKLC